MVVVAFGQLSAVPAANASTVTDAVTNFQAFVGTGTGRANPKLSPINIGVINEQNGSIEIAPEWTTGATLAAAFMNKETGGIDGHPVELTQCFIPDTVTSANQCGQQMANTKSIAAVSVGPEIIGNEAMEDDIAPTHKLLVWGVSIGATDAAYPYGYILNGDSDHILSPQATFISQNLKAKSVSIVWPLDSGDNASVTIIEDALAKAGIKTVDSVGFDPTDTDLSTALEAAHVGQTSVFIADGNSTQCADMYLALKQLAIKTTVIASIPCASTQTATADGGTLPHDWYYGSVGSIAGDASDTSLAAFAAVTRTFHDTQWTDDSWVESSFAQMITLGKWYTEVLTEHKALNPANLNAVARAFKGPVPMGPPSLNCHGFPHAPAVCNDHVEYFENTAPKVMKPIALWIGPPAGFKIPASLE
jgi:branched-chain amino acid transport system substrate-binding protein